MDSTSSASQPPIDLPAYLLVRREVLLHNWKKICDDDPSLTAGDALSREEFNDNAPSMLEFFGQQVSGEQPTIEQLSLMAAEHGLHRWHRGYTLRELLVELNYLNQCLAGEISAYAHLYPGTDLSQLTRAYELVVQFGSRLISSSVEQYTTLEQNQAAERAALLQQALDTLTEVNQQRGQLLRMTSHDLRGGFGVIQGAASLLNLPDADDERRSTHLQMLRRNLLSVSNMLVQLTDLSRLEAGQEQISIQPVDVGVLLRAIVESAQPLAAERNLILQGDGPDTMLVDTDAVLVQRIVQNLLLNALQHTRTGIISVSWSNENSFRWTVSVQDTGTGMPAHLINSLVKPLKPTQESAAIFDQPEADETIPQPEKTASSGEGIGLHIVKWLCQLLNASIDIETRPNQGTLIRVRLPVQVHSAEPR